MAKGSASEPRRLIRLPYVHILYLTDKARVLRGTTDAVVPPTLRYPPPSASPAPVSPAGRHGWSPHVSPGCCCSAAAAFALSGGALAAGEPGGHGELEGWLQGLASGWRRRGGVGGWGEARRAKEGGKRLTGKGQEGLTTVRRFSAG